MIKAEDNITLKSNKNLYDNAQYFWQTSDGTDTGAHITEVTKDVFLADPDNSGSNLLARSNGIVVRDGMDELAIFGATGMQIGKSDEQNIRITSSDFYVSDPDGGTPFFIDTEETKTTAGREWGYIVNSGSTVTQTLLLKGNVVDNKYYIAVGSTRPTTYTQYIEDPSSSGTSITIDGVTVTLTKVSDNAVMVKRVNSNSSKRYVLIKVTESYYPAQTVINQKIMSPTYERISIEDSVGTCSIAYAHTYGNVAHIRFTIYNSSSITNKGTIYQGTMINALPVSPAPIIGFASGGLIVGMVYASGLVQIRNFTGSTVSISSSSTADVVGTYILADG